MKNSLAIALLLGVSVEAVNLDPRYQAFPQRSHYKMHDSPSLAAKKHKLVSLEKDLARLRRDFANLKDEEESVHRAHMSFVQ